MRPKLDATNLHLIDLKDQPPSSHILLVAEMLGGAKGIGVDEAYPDPTGRTVSFFRVIRGGLHQTNRLVAMLPTHLAWTMVERPLFEIVGYRDVAAKVAADTKDMDALAREMFPEQYAQAQQGTQGGIVEAENLLQAGGKRENGGVGFYL